MKLLIDEMGINRSLTRMAHEIIERNKGVQEVVLVGIKTRGEFLAKRLKTFIDQIEKTDITVLALDIVSWRDDVQKNQYEPFLLEKDVTNKVVVLVDDVLCSGRTIRAAMDGIFYNGRAKRIQLAILVDRGHRELPIKADYIGKNIPTSLNESIVVKLHEKDGEDGIFID